MSSARLAGRPVAGLLLDYGLTLVTYSRPAAAIQQARGEIVALVNEGSDGPLSSQLLAQAGVQVEAALRDNVSSGAFRELDVAALYESAFAALGCPLDSRRIDEVMRIEQEAWWLGMRVGPYVHDTLNALRGAGLRLGLCSNAPYRLESLRGQLAHLGLSARLDSATFSAEVGWRKPAPELFAAALAALGTSAEETVMVGDAGREDVGGARGAGLRAIRTREFHDDQSGSAVPDLVIDSFRSLPGALGLANACSDS